MVILATARLQLREFVEVDWLDLYAIESDPEVAHYQSFEPRTKAESLAYTRRAIASAREDPRRTFDLAVVVNDLKGVAGRCGLQIVRPELREAMVWYTLRRSLWGNGYTPEALHALVDFGFKELELGRIWADCDPANRPSYRVLEKVGLRREAYLRDNVWIKSHWADSLIYSVSNRDWLR